MLTALILVIPHPLLPSSYAGHWPSNHHRHWCTHWPIGRVWSSVWSSSLSCLAPCPHRPPSSMEIVINGVCMGHAATRQHRHCRPTRASKLQFVSEIESERKTMHLEAREWEHSLAGFPLVSARARVIRPHRCPCRCCHRCCHCHHEKKKYAPLVPASRPCTHRKLRPA
jgi:hypothetical protein